MPELIASAHIDDVILVRPDVHGDERGRFVETYRRSWFGDEANEMVQGNRSEKQAGAVAIPLEPIPGVDMLYDFGMPIALIWYWYTFFRDARRLAANPQPPAGQAQVTPEKQFIEQKQVAQDNQATHRDR